MSENPAIPAPIPAQSTGRAAPSVLAEVVRSGFVEGWHRGSLVLLGAGGEVELAGERPALAAASHSGEEFHRDLVRKMLAERGLSAARLQKARGAAPAF